jgi:hypothetical protein
MVRYLSISEKSAGGSTYDKNTAHRPRVKRSLKLSNSWIAIKNDSVEVVAVVGEEEIGEENENGSRYLGGLGS